MLGAGGLALALHAAHRGSRHFAGEQRVFGEVLKVAAAERIALDVHPRGELHVHAVVDHLLAHLGGEGLDQFRVPGASQGRAAGLQRTVLLQSKPRRAVGGDDRPHALLSQALNHAAEGARVARHAETASHHAVTPAEGFQLFVTQPGDEVVQRDLPAFDIIERIAPNAGDRDGFRQTAEDPRTQLCAGFAELFALLYGDFLVKGEAARRRVIGREAVFTALQHKAAAVLVVGGQALVVTAQRQGLTLTGGEGFCLSEGREHPQGLVQPSRRRLAPELHDFFAGQRPGVGDSDHGFRLVPNAPQALGFQSKACVAQAESEGIERLVGMPVEVPIAHIDAFGVVVEIFPAEVRAAGVILIAAGDGIAELAAWRDRPGEHVRHGVSALHAALPDDHQSGELVPVCLRPGHVHDIADVQQHRDPGKRGGDRIQHGPLLVGQVEASLGESILPVFSRGAADHHQRGLCGLRGLLHQRGLQRHLGVVHRPVAPPAVVGHVVLLPRPGLIGVQHLGVESQPGIAQAVDQVHMVGRVHIAAAAVAHVEPIQLAAAEHGHFLFFVQRQRAVVFQQHAALGSRLPNEFSDPRRHIALAVRRGLLLHQAVSHGPVDDPLREFSQLIFQFFHDGTPYRFRWIQYSKSHSVCPCRFVRILL